MSARPASALAGNALATAAWLYGFVTTPIHTTIAGAVGFVLAGALLCVSWVGAVVSWRRAQAAPK